MTQVSLSTSTNYSGDLNALIEDQGTALTVRFDLDEPAPEGGLKVYIDSDIEQILNRLDLPSAIANPQVENLNLLATQTNFDNSGLAVEITEGSTFATVTLNIFDNDEPDTFLPETFDGLVEASFSLVTAEDIAESDQSNITGVGDYTIDPNAGSSTVIFADEESQLTDTVETPDESEEPTVPTVPDPNSGTDALQVSLFTGPDYLIEDEGTVSAHAFLATNGVIPEGGLVVSVDAPNLSEFDLAGISVEGGEIEAVRDGGFDLRMTDYTTLVNLPIADDGETEVEETATFSLAAGEGYEIIADYSSSTFNLVDTVSDIPQGVISEPNQTIPTAVDTQISPENPTFSGTADIYFDIGDRYLKEDGTYQYIDYSEDVDVYKVDLSAGDTIAIETFDDERNSSSFGQGIGLWSQIYDAEGTAVRDYGIAGASQNAAPDKLFGGISPFDENETDSYQEFTAPEDGSYYIAFGNGDQVLNFVDYAAPFYDPFTPGSGQGNRTDFGFYGIEINLLTEDNPRAVGTPTPPVSNPDVANPPTFSLSATPTTIDAEGNLTNAVVERAPENGVSSVNFTIEAEGDIPEGGIEFVLNSDANLFDYVSFNTQSDLPSTIGGQSLGAFYDEDGIPTGIRLLIEEPIMTVTYESSNPLSGVVAQQGNIFDAFEPLETDGAENVTFFLQPGEGYEIAPDAGETEVTYYDSLADVPPPTGGSDTVPEVGVTVSESTLIESEGTETTITFSLSEPPPAEGVTVFVDSEDNTVVGSPLGQFDVLEAEIEGGNFPIPNSDSSGFFFTITEQTATITLDVFDELTVDTGLPPVTFQEGILDLTFALQPQAGYTIDPNASEVNFSILDNLDSQIQVSLTAEPESLIESEGTIGVHTFSLSAPPPSEGLTVSVSADSLDDFDLDAVEVTGGTIAEVRSDGFDLTITEREATISLPILEDGTNEGSETATFTLEPGDTYEINAAATEATFTLADTVDQISTASGDIEFNNTIPEANALSLSSDTPSVSISGGIGPGDFLDLPEDVDIYAFNLEAGQTVSLDIDTEESLVNGIISFRPVVFPALADIVQTFDTELRLFDADGNELAANNDGAAPDEDFSRDPFIEYTADSAGTYYVGVSQLGNRNYDPFVFRDGSGWTFPEVGVFNGFYELTASLGDGTVDPGDPTDPVDPTDPATPEFEPIFGSIDGDTIEVEGSGQLIFAGDLNDLVDATTGEGNNRIYAGNGDDTIVLGSSDRILAGAGDDAMFVTSGGDNTLTGGDGADQFWIATAELPESANIITDFMSGEDVIGLAGLGIGFTDITLTTVEGDALISANDSELAILQGVDASVLSESDFAFA
ncbi:MAG: pre-peptidase C-terminal domain-containing protein [Cyanobacteria bacterium P01_G01_bin.19]